MKFFLCAHPALPVIFFYFSGFFTSGARRRSIPVLPRQHASSLARYEHLFLNELAFWRRCLSSFVWFRSALPIPARVSCRDQVG